MTDMTDRNANHSDASPSDPKPTWSPPSVRLMHNLKMTENGMYSHRILEGGDYYPRS